VPQRLIHLIEDDHAVRDALAFQLDAAGYQVLRYESGLEFLEVMPDCSRGCVVTDMRMPGLNGIELTAQLRRLRPDLPVIVISGHADDALASLAARAGAREFLEKPFDDEMLLEALERAYN
jgi:two-component system response regulator FixJ